MFSTQLCINTAIVYMHRFYMFHSFTKFHRNCIAPACLFLAAKVEEQPRKLEHVVGVAHRCLNRDAPALTPDSEKYLEKAQELVIDENILLQTLGFDITVDHPHTHVVKTCQLVRASKDLAQTSYFLATNSLHLSMMCLTVKPTVVACVAIHLACKWSSWELPRSSEGKDWWWYVEKGVTKEMLEELTDDFLSIIERCPTRLKGKIMTWKSGKREEVYGEALEMFKDRNSPLPTTSRPSPKPEVKPSIQAKPSSLVKDGRSSSSSHKDMKSRSPDRGREPRDENKERKDRDRHGQPYPRKPNGAASDPSKTGDHSRTLSHNPSRPKPDERHPSRPDSHGHDRSRTFDNAKRPPDGRRPEPRPDEKKPPLKPKVEVPRPRPSDSHSRHEGDHGESHRERDERRREEAKRHEHHSKEHLSSKPLVDIPPASLPPVKAEKVEPDLSKHDLSRVDLSDLFGDSPSTSSDFVAAIEQELKATEGLNVDTPPGVDYGLDSSLLDLMATPPSKVMRRPDFSGMLEAQNEAFDRERKKLDAEAKAKEERDRARREQEEAEKRQLEKRKKARPYEKSGLPPEEIKKLEDEPSPYKKEKLYSNQDREDRGRSRTAPSGPSATSESAMDRSFDWVRKQAARREAEVSDRARREAEASISKLPGSDSVTQSDQSLNPSLPDAETKTSLKVRLPKPQSSRYPSPSSQPERTNTPESVPSLKLTINPSAATVVEPLKLKISLGGKDKDHHKEKKKHRKDEDRHRHKHKSKSKSHDHDRDREHKSRKRALSPSGGPVEAKVRKHVDSSSGATLVSPNMQPVVELQKITDAQIRRNSKSPGSTGAPPMKRPQFP